jgi:hypothetical protein
MTTLEMATLEMTTLDTATLEMAILETARPSPCLLLETDRRCERARPVGGSLGN